VASTRYVELRYLVCGRADVVLEGTTRRYVSKFGVEFSQKRCSSLTPTFFSPFLTRRYSLATVVTLHGDRAQKFRLEIPVQIYAGSDCREQGLPAYESEVVRISANDLENYSNPSLRGIKVVSSQHICLDSESLVLFIHNYCKASKGTQIQRTPCCNRL